MYRNCLFCSADLGTNEVIEPFPVGRRLAFDAAKGRLWVICRSCERWNLTPLEERWEAVEEAERTFRDTPLRASTEQVGLARHREGLDLVRIGAPQLPEFAAWRYGDQFGRRRRRHIRRVLVGVGVTGGIVVGSAGVLGAAAALQLGANAFNVVNALRTGLQPAVRIGRDDGTTLSLRLKDLREVKLRPGPGDPSVEGGKGIPGQSDPLASGNGDGAAWHLRVAHREGNAILTGREAVRALRVLLPKANATGAARRVVEEAVRELEETGGPEPYFAAAEFRARRSGWGYTNLFALPRPIRLALEMAAHEDAERVALEGELAWLESAWREAEEIAAIADNLALPERVRIRFEELKARRRGRGRSADTA